MDALHIRAAVPSELEAVIEVWYRSLDASLQFLRPEQRHTPSEERAFFREVVARECALHVAERGDRVVAVLAMRSDEVDRLYVAPHAQRTRVGSALLLHAKQLSPRGLHLVTLQRNQPARRFYERHGFTEYAYGYSPAPENEPDVRYRWVGPLARTSDPAR